MWRVRLRCPLFDLPPSTPSHLRPVRLDQDYYFQLNHSSAKVSLIFYNSATPKEDYERPLEIIYVPDEMVELKFVNRYKTITYPYKSHPLESKFIFSVSKLDIKMWLTVARQLCPLEVRNILRYRRAIGWTNNATQTIIFGKNYGTGPVLWREEGRKQTMVELERK